MRRSNRRRKKEPGQSQSPQARSKNPSSRPENISEKRFLWRTSKVDLDGRWGWGQVDARLLLKEIIPKLQDYESMKWGEIEGRNSHFVKVEQCCKDAQQRLQEIEKDDFSELFSLRMNGKKRIFGIRQSAELQILWWDPEHEICPSTKK